MCPAIFVIYRHAFFSAQSTLQTGLNSEHPWWQREGWVLRRKKRYEFPRSPGLEHCFGRIFVKSQVRTFIKRHLRTLDIGWLNVLHQISNHLYERRTCPQNNQYNTNANWYCIHELSALLFVNRHLRHASFPSRKSRDGDDARHLRTLNIS